MTDPGRASGRPARLRPRRPPIVTNVRVLLAQTAGICLLLIVAYSALPLSGRRRWISIVIGSLVLLSVVPVVTRRVGRVLRADKPLWEALAAVVITATVGVVGSAGIYYTMARSGPDQFQSLHTKIDGVYFAITVMTTIGFGDIVPLSQAARLVTTLHIIFTVVFLGAAFRVITFATRSRINEPT